MKKSLLLFIGVFALLTACGNEEQTTNSKTQNDFFVKEEQESMEKTDKGSKHNILHFATGLQIVLPELWDEKILIEIEPGTEEYGGGLIVCEKSNAEANAGGVLFYLKYYLKDENTVEPYEIFDTDKVLGICKKNEEEYALIFELPREMNYVEGSKEMQQKYEMLYDLVGEVQREKKLT